MRILIVGAGDVGRVLAKKLSERGHSVMVIDKDVEKITRIGREADVEAYDRDAIDPSIYEDIGLRTFDVVVAATNRDEVNLFVAAMCKVYGVKNVYVRVNSEKTSRILHMLGVSGVILQPNVVANLLYSMIQGYYSAEIISTTLSGEYIIIAGVVKTTSPVGGKKIKDLYKMLPGDSKILAVFDGKKLMDPDEIPSLEPGHVVIALVREEDVKDFEEMF